LRYSLGFPVAAVVAAETYESTNPATTSLAVLFASGLLFIISAFAAISLDARRHAEALLAQEAATGEARQRAAALDERSRLARDLHDVLAHSLSALAVQLEATRLMAITMGVGARLVGQVASAHKLTCIGMLEARRALQMLRGDEAPGPVSLPDLVSGTSRALGIPITLEVEGVPRPLGSDAGITLYRVVQEALTNVAKHAGYGARVTVRLVWASDGAEVSIVDCGGDGVDAGLPSSGFGLTSMAERAALNGGWLHAGRSDGGFAVILRLPASPTAPGGAVMRAAADSGAGTPGPAGPDDEIRMVSGSAASVRVLVADDLKAVRDGLCMLLGMLPGIEVIGTAIDGNDAIYQAMTAVPDIVLMDLHMPNCDGIEATRRIVHEQPGVRVVVLTAYSDDDSVFAALRAGARGFLTKNAGASEILRAVSTVYAGDAQLDPSVQRRLVEAVAEGARVGGVTKGPWDQVDLASDGLTQREIEVLTEIAAGLSNAELADKFRISSATVKTHINHLLAKTGSRDRAQLVAYAFRRGLAA
jgi:DNA-binding NarL/FixJ family response regulator/signal transduction histidine kinase